MRGNINKFEKREIKLYSLLGVSAFRKFVLWFEKLRHRYDGDQNKNYHPKSISISSMESFSGYLIYNSLFHIVSILLIIVYFVISTSLRLNYLWIDIIMYIVVVFDLYCIMLQRYIYLRMKSHITKAKVRRSDRIQESLNTAVAILADRAEEDIREEFELLTKIYNCCCKGEECFLEKKCADTLSRLAVVAAVANSNVQRRAKKCEAKDSLNQMITALSGRTLLKSSVENRVSGIQKLIRVDKTRNVAFGFCIITEDNKCEDAYRQVFPDVTRDKFEFLCSFLLAVYKQRELVMK